jgi:diguanylate cyclase (GGDEF)-like protein
VPVITDAQDPSKVINILIVEDHALVREAMSQSLQQLADEVHCGQAGDGLEALKRMGEESWDMVLLDLMLPDLSGFSLLNLLSKRHPDLPVVVVSALNDPASIRQAMNAGASGFIHKSNSAEGMIKAIREVLDGGRCLPADMAAADETLSDGASFSRQHGLNSVQSRILGLLAQGKTNREIGTLTGFAEHMVKAHVSGILKQLKVARRSQAALLFNTYEVSKRAEALEEANARLTAEAHTDPLTGVPNRRHFMEQAQLEVKRALRHGTPLALLMMDLDHFKQINDKWGHSVGDAVLQHFVRQVAPCFRETDFFGRIGGEEFAVLLPGSGHERAQQAALRLLEAVRLGRFVYEDIRFQYTTSVGIGNLLPQDHGVDTLLNRADLALYRAKKAGRNCCSEGSNASL